MLPFEFIIIGIPLSHQSKNKRNLDRWKTQVRTAASSKWPAGTPPLSYEVSFDIQYYYNTDAPDVDNIIKPVQDALKGLIYDDDAQIAHTSSRKSKIDGAFRVKGASHELVLALADGEDFLRVRILPPPSHEDLS